MSNNGRPARKAGGAGWNIDRTLRREIKGVAAGRQAERLRLGEAPVVYTSCGAANQWPQVMRCFASSRNAMT
jgi:hypothetical protein